MIHPNTELKFVSSNIGYGIFATTDIPKGTIVYVKDKLEIVLDEKAFNALDESCQAIANKYSYIDENGQWILSWDNAKYVNHSCNCNTISTAYGFEIAIRDIAEGEEITDEYGLFNIDETIALACNCPNCRMWLKPSDIDEYFQVWDQWVCDALSKSPKVPQPLMTYMDSKTKKSLHAYICGNEPYISVQTLKYIKQQDTINQDHPTLTQSVYF